MSGERASRQLERRVAGVVAALMGAAPGDVTARTALAAIDGWDSVNALRVLMYLERSLGATLDYEHFSAATTVGDLAAVAAAASSAAGARDG